MSDISLYSSGQKFGHLRRAPLHLSWRPLAVLAVAAALAACANPGAQHPPLAQTQPSALGLSDLPANAEQLPTPHWWTALGDPELDALIDRALLQQPSIAVAQARAAQAASLADARRAANGPQVGLGIDVTRERYSANGLFPPPIAGSTLNNGTIQASASWSPDFFGLHRAELDASLGQARAAQADAAAAANTLATQLTRSWVELARVLADQEVAQETLKQRRDIDRLTRERVGAGLDSQVELTQSQSAVPEAAAQLEALAEQATLKRRQIAVLSGQAPDALPALSPQLTRLKLLDVPTVLGADLLGRRPDVVAARWRIEAATQGVKAARQSFYPDINLAAFIGLNSIGLDRLFQAGSRQIGVAPALRLPIFEGGRLRAQLGGKQAELDGIIAQYNGAVLDAVKQAGDSLASVQSIDRQQDLRAQALAGAEKAWRLSRERYGAGLGNYLVVLNTESQVLAQRHQSVALQARALDVRLTLMNALGGGWSDDTASLQAAAR